MAARAKEAGLGIGPPLCNCSGAFGCQRMDDGGDFDRVPGVSAHK